MLLVEDDNSSATALKLILERVGWEVTVAATVSEGLKHIAAEPDVLILDLMLPDGDGATILEYIRRANLGIRVAVTTGSSDPERLNYVSQLNPDLVLRKPIDLSKLLNGISPLS